MRLYVLIAALFFTQPAAAQDAPIRATIQSQIDAMAADDFAAAFAYAAPNIKGIFGSADRFEAMVRSGYPMVVAPREVRMLELRTVAGNLWQRVLMVDNAGATHLLDYMMVEIEGGWRIAAVQLLPSQGVSA
ncbi:MAG: DUF4864 domain-containing protein [Cypionkella sp.]|nr:DUF4864 domain-containing protein [Cypionkella sp.]